MTVSSEASLDDVRRTVSAALDPERRAMLGQYMTPTVIADFMAGMIEAWPAEVRLLDPGAGIGSLTEAFSRRFLEKAPAGATLDITAYEIDPVLLSLLKEHLAAISLKAESLERKMSAEIIARDFIESGTFSQAFAKRQFTHAILNPPYKKIGATSTHRKALRAVGIETVNLYTAFLAVAVALTQDGGEIVAIIPRSFCNGAYYRPFREWLFARAALTRIHIFGSRKKAFKEDNVLQENIIVRLVRGATQGNVNVTTSHDALFQDFASRTVPFIEIVKPEDAEQFIHIPTVELQHAPKLFSHTLAELGLSVSTGPVVDFRLKDFWLAEPTETSIPLLYAHHFAGGEFRWPRPHKKPNALIPGGPKWLMPAGWYVVTKRFSSKEERRRVVAYVVDPNLLPSRPYGFENHLNVIHASKHGLEPEIAKGLAVFLNSTVLDQYFRNFSGHTQVNATDLRSMGFPSRALLVAFGKWAEEQDDITQEKIDRFVEGHYAD